MKRITISDRSDLPLYKQIIEQIKIMIANSDLKPGEKIPTVRELANTLRINPATVAHAYQESEREGILGVSRRRGTIVMGESENLQKMPLR